MKDAMKEFWLDFGVALLFVIALFAVVFFFSGCKVLKEVKSSSKDSTSVSKINEGSARVDSSGSKTDKVYNKETIYYPQPIYVQGKDGETKVVVVPQSVRESGQDKTETAHIITDTSWKDAFNSLTVLIANKEVDKKVKVGPSFLEWILIAGIGLLLIKNFLPFKIIKT